MISSIIQPLSFIKIQPNMSEQKKKKINKKSMICLTPKPNQSLFVYCIQSKENFLLKRSFLRKSGSRGLKKIEKKAF